MLLRLTLEVKIKKLKRIILKEKNHIVQELRELKVVEKIKPKPIIGR
jgi:hypothetical protein